MAERYTARLFEEFITKFGGDKGSIKMYYAPGRVNLIGEHTDYNGGYVFPAALTWGTTMLIRKRNDSRVRLASLNFELEKTLQLDELHYDEKDGWVNYPKAMLSLCKDQSGDAAGYDILFDGQIPNGAGLSSSASLLVASGYGLLDMQGVTPDRVKLALTAQRAENEFLGVNCGIMDQFAIALGKKGHALLLQCNDQTYEHVPIELGEHVLVISNTNKRRGLIDSQYNLRRTQCEEALAILQNSSFPELASLCELSPNDFSAHAAQIADESCRKRAEHAVNENARVLESVEALKQGKLERFGELMNASHASLRDLYDVSCKELDVLVEAAQKVDEVLGSRMTGAGFGGCTVSLVHKSGLERFKQEVGRAYQQQTGLQADFYTAAIGDGVKRIESRSS